MSKQVTKSKVQVKCPKCKSRGGVVARRDAFHDYRLYIEPNQTTLTWVPDGVVDMEYSVYECFNCFKELSKSSIEKFNNVTL